MSTFTIDAENNITAHAALLAGTDESQSFSSAKELAKLTADWPVSRLVETWNSFAGVTPFNELKPVKKFTSRKAAVTRIWQAVARLSQLRPDFVGYIKMYGPPLGVKQKLEIGRSGSAKMYSAYWWSELLAMMKIRARCCHVSASLQLLP